MACVKLVCYMAECIHLKSEGGGHRGEAAFVDHPPASYVQDVDDLI